MSDKIVWPVGISVPESVKQLIIRFFTLADTNSDSSPDEIAALFTENGEMHGLGGVLSGREAIRIGRAKSWNGISNRNHRVQAVYSHDLEASDMLLVGVIDAALTNGKTLSAEFAARVAINFEGAAKEKPRIALYKSWADSAPWVKAMSG